MKQLVYVYISGISDDLNIHLPSYIDVKKISNQSVLAEKRSAYSLLYRAAKEFFGVDMDLSMLTKTESGKPVYPDFHFSISHSKGICAVALSKNNVGIDIEREISEERETRIKKKILHKNESPDTDITELWTKKEAVFKLTGKKIFIPHEIDTTVYNTESKKVHFDGKEHTVTVATDNVTESIWQNNRKWFTL